MILPVIALTVATTLSPELHRSRELVELLPEIRAWSANPSAPPSPKLRAWLDRQPRKPRTPADRESDLRWERSYVRDIAQCREVIELIVKHNLGQHRLPRFEQLITSYEKQLAAIRKRLAEDESRPDPAKK